MAEFAHSPASAVSTPSRRMTIALMFVATSLASGVILSNEVIGAASKPSEIRAGSWLVGGNLSLAAMSYFRGTGPHENTFGRAQNIASTYLGVDIKPLPTKPATSSDGLLAMLDYFNKGDGASIGNYIQLKHGDDASTLYVTAVRTLQLPLFYDLDPPLGDKFAQLIRGNMTKLKVPESMWKPVVDAVAKRTSFDNLRSAVIKMDDDVTQYLLKT
jgi:hypothetical protein